MAGSVELLAPAGDAECLEFALAYGADAVYLGAKEYGMRSSCDNFTDEELYAAAEQAHRRGKAVYLTLNTLPTNRQLDALPRTVCVARDAGTDAFIVADLGVLELVKRHAPDVAVHVSTQAGIANYAAAAAAHRLGAQRVVLARELALADIAEIRRRTPPELELEVFVHGAMCMSLSGRCLLSAHLAGRSADRGRCAQSCRWKYRLVEEKRPWESYEIGEGEDGSYILSADDLCTAGFLDKILEAGVAGLKMEGRAKSFYYVASVTAAYRRALDAALRAQKNGGAYVCPPEALEELEKTSHRPYSPGFFLGRDNATQSPRQEGYLRAWQPVAVVKRQEGQTVFCTQRSKVCMGQAAEALLPTGGTVPVPVADMRDETGAVIAAAAHPKMPFSFELPPGVVLPPLSILRVPNAVPSC